MDRRVVERAGGRRGSHAELLENCPHYVELLLTSKHSGRCRTSLPQSPLLLRRQSAEMLTLEPPSHYGSMRGAVWLVRSGKDRSVFAVGLVRGEPVGARYRCARSQIGEAMFAIPALSEHSIVAVGRIDTVVEVLTTTISTPSGSVAGSAGRRWIAL